MTTSGEHLPRHRIEEPDDAARAHLATCEGCAARAAAFEAARAAHARVHPPQFVILPTIIQQAEIRDFAGRGIDTRFSRTDQSHPAQERHNP